MSRRGFTILIAGAGQLGSRYLQGLVKCGLPLAIHVQDCCAESLDRAQQRWKEMASTGFSHDVSFQSSLELVPRELDMAIVATTADVRSKVVGEIANHAGVRFWVLEKVLAQSEAGLDELISHVGSGSKAWVNTPRRMMPWYRQIKAQLGLNRPLTLKVSGGEWGLACNAVHFLDLCAWWTGETLQSIRTDRLNPSWINSKRKGFQEVSGTLEAEFSGGSRASLRAGEGEAFLPLEVSDRHKSWQIEEVEGVARCSDGIEIRGRMPYQSEMSAALVEAILGSGQCDLPSLEDSIALHRVFIRSMLVHWKRAGNPTATFVPIT